MAKREGNIVGAERAFFGCLEWRDDGRIAALNEYEPVRGDAAWLLPGFVDLHLHGVGQGNAESEAGIRAMAEFEPATGVTGFCPTLDTEDAEATREYLENVRRTAGGVPGGARVLGAHLEGPYLDYAHRGGMNPECLRAPDIHEVERWLACAQGTLKLVTLAPELPGAAADLAILEPDAVTVRETVLAGRTIYSP